MSGWVLITSGVLGGNNPRTVVIFILSGIHYMPRQPLPPIIAFQNLKFKTHTQTCLVAGYLLMLVCVYIYALCLLCIVCPSLGK